MSAVYIGNLDVEASVNDLHREFDRYGRIKDVWVARKPPGFAFVEFEDERDARDAVRDMDGRFILDKRIRAEISRRGRGGERRDVPRGPPRRTDNKVKISNLADTVGWRELKDMLREVAEPAYVDTFGNGTGVAEFMHESDIDRVISKLDDTRLHGTYIRIKEDVERTGRDSDRGRGRDEDRDKDDREKKDRKSSRGKDDKSRSRSRSRDDGDRRRRRSDSADR